jgi:hypothetical protein
MLALGKNGDTLLLSLVDVKVGTRTTCLTPASVARRYSLRLLPHLAPPPNHRCKSPQGLVDGCAVREDIKDIVPYNNDVGAFSIPRCGSAACCAGEVIFRAHGRRPCHNGFPVVEVRMFWTKSMNRWAFAICSPARPALTSTLTS